MTRNDFPRKRAGEPGSARLMTSLTTFAVRRRRWVIGVWLLMLIAGGAAAGQVSQRLSSDFSLPGQPGYETAQKMRHSYGNGGQPPSVLTVTACLLRHVVRPCGRGLATPWKVDPDNVMLAGECPDHRAPRGATLTGAKPQAVARQAARECAIGATAGQ